MSFITSYCSVSADSCSVNGKLLLSDRNTTDKDLLKTLFKNLQIDYPKFYKMDALCKAAFVGTELLRKQLTGINNYRDDDIALIFSNKNSSADTDIKFHNSYTSGALPSPALFVYTLPNILMGEIAIRNQWYGENLFFIAPDFNAVFFENYIQIMLNKNSKACLCGWVEVIENNVEAFLFFVEQSDSSSMNLPLTSKILANLFPNNREKKHN